MNYAEKIALMSEKLESLAILNAQLGLVNQYFQEQTPQQAPAPQGEPVAQAPQGKVH
jgi:hypothetical protein